MRGINETATNAPLIERLKDLAEKSIFWDHHSPGTRDQRRRARENFEYFVEQVYGVTQTEEIWNEHTIIERCKMFIGAVPQWAKGKINIQIKVGSLYHIKNALYWWAVRFIPSFSTIHLRWHTQITAHIHLTAEEYQLPTECYEKNNLTEAELMLFYDAVSNMAGDAMNWKQHALAWSLVWCTGVRPGSITVAVGYHKGASLGFEGSGHERQEDETLRWRDIEWIRYPHGIGALITYRFIKGYRSTYARNNDQGQLQSN